MAEKFRFRCPHCGKLALGQSDWVGKTAKCPNPDCGQQIIVPSPKAVEPPPVPTLEPDELELEPPPPTPTAAEFNPYQSFGDMPSSLESSGSRSEASNKVKAPAITLIVVGALNALAGVWFVISSLSPPEDLGPMPAEVQDNEFLRTMWEASGEPATPSEIAWFVFMIVAAVVVIFGGVKMLQLKTYGLAMTAAILSMIPCVTCMGCCGAGQVVGIWALVVLLNETVRASFS